MPKIDLDTLPTYRGHGVADRLGVALGDYVGRSISAAAGLTALGASVEVLEPGSTSSVRHWHDRTDEIVVILSGCLTLVEEHAETPLGPGDIAAFAAGVPNGHCLENRTDAPASFLVVGSRDADDRCIYPDVEQVLLPDGTLTGGSS